MKIHLLGHASLLVETQNCKILMDPVLWDPFCEGLNESCPKREVMVEQLPKDIDFLVISHRHLDHFDLRSLAYLPKTMDVLIPKDPLLQDCLRQLGYTQIYSLADFTKVCAGATTLMTTRSEVQVPEFGMVIADESGVFWNTVDTYFAAPTIQAVRANFPTIDFLLTTWHISMEGKYQANQPLAFPLQYYGCLFNLISLVQPKAIAPGAQGFKYIGKSAWQNQTVFPVTRERFCHDLETAFPTLKETIFQLNPGDCFTLNQGQYEQFPAGSDYAKMLVDDRDLVDFAPVIAGNPLTDPNPEQIELETLEQTIETEICQDFLQFILEHQRTLFYEHCHWQVIYQIEVTFPNRDRRRWSIDFSQDTIQIKPGRNPHANLFSYITASSLCSLIHKKRDWDYLLCSGEYRGFHSIYSMSQWGAVSPDMTSIADPIRLRFSPNYIASNNVYKELKKWTSPDSVPPSTKSEPTLFQLGNLLIRLKKSQQPANHSA